MYWIRIICDGAETIIKSKSSAEEILNFVKFNEDFVSITDEIKGTKVYLNSSKISLTQEISTSIEPDAKIGDLTDKIMTRIVEKLRSGNNPGVIL